MKANELLELIKSGSRPVIKITEKTFDYIEDSFDVKMMGRIVGATIEYDAVRFLVDMNDFDAHNRSVAEYNWFDKDGKATLTWFDTIFYPKDGKEVIYIPPDAEIPFEFVEDNTLLNEYIQSNSDSNYTHWLEKLVLELREKGNA